VALDWLGGSDKEEAADRLVALGIGSTLPAIVSGANDWADTTVGNPTVRRVGLVHALGNATATSLFTGSLIARRRGARGTGKLLALAGAGLMGASGHLGGHLSFADAVGADHTAFEAPVDDWTDVLADAELADGRPHCAEVEGVPVLVMRDRGELVALSDRCAHRGGALHEGEIDDGCVVCPLHGSRFRLRDGSVERGPSAYPQPVWEIRARDGRIEVRRPAEE
jgi:nitrite reductase/ring-hydroxylating ferredoxin subunit